MRTLRAIVASAVALQVIGFVSAVSASDAGVAAVALVSEEAYRHVHADLLYTHNGDDRGFGPEHNLAQANIVQLLESYGLEVTLEPVIYFGQTYYNVVGTKSGEVYPDKEYIVGAHYDSVDNPGADDNASGTALVLEAARVLSPFPSDYTIRFVAFDREEQGLWGSEAYVDAHITDDILGMISTDMVAYNTGMNQADIFARAASMSVQNSLMDAIALYGDGLFAAPQGSSGSSDHAPFESAGFPACLLIEDWGNPNYHTQADSVDTPNYIDYPYATKMTQSVVGWLTDQAGIHVFTANGDYDEDADVDYYDFWWFQKCFTGAGVPTPDTMDCFRFDFDYDQDVDLDDYAEMEARFTGPLYDDCNDNGYPDEDDIAGNHSTDCNLNGIPDECEPDCDADGIPDECALASGSADCNQNTIPDECELADNDCNANGVPDECEPPVLLFFDNFESDLGWTVENTDLDTGAWERAAPQATGAQPGEDYPGGEGTLCYVTDGRSGLGSGAYDVDGGPTQLISPVFNVGVTNVTLSYAYWFYNDDGDDTLEVEVSIDNGDSWLPLVTHDTSQGQWREHSVLIDDVVTPGATMRLRFTTSDNPNDSITEAAIDDVSVWIPDCAP